MTIAAISTPRGTGGIAVVRMSGKNSLQIAQKITKFSGSSPKITPRKAILCDVIDGDMIVDECILLFFPAPKSFTGEDVIELQCHGSEVIARQILNLCITHGATLARPGEFTKRAFVNGKIDASQSLAICDLINAKDAESARLLARQMKGELKIFIQNSRENLLRALAFSEALIDYAEDIEARTVQDLERNFDEILQKFSRILEFSRMRADKNGALNLVIIGKPNVGKSSLLNALLLENRAIVSAVAGTTRDVVSESVEIAGRAVRVSDTAGIRASCDEIEQIGVEKSFAEMAAADFVAAVFDGAHTLNAEDERVICEILSRADPEKTVILVNKIDLQRAFSKEILREKLPNFKNFCEISTKNPSQILKFKEKIAQMLEKSTQNHGEFLLTREFQITAIAHAIYCIKSAKIALKNHEFEIFSFDIKEAILRLNELTEPYEISQMFDVMFSEFCVGK